MDRRSFLHGLLVGGAAGCLSVPSAAIQASDRSGTHLLSTQGCGRATGYAESNKIVTVDDKTHVAWLDSPPEGFRVRARTYDRQTGQWSPVYHVGNAYDNHGGPALTVDSQGYLHVVYHPHHHPFRYRRSRRPNDASEWEDEVQFGQRCTYPTLVCGPDDTLYFTCRRSFTDQPWQVELWTKHRGERWQGPRAILRSRHKGYSHFQESLAWGPDHKTLHLCCRFHEHSDADAYGRLQTVGYLVSRDFGHTWQRSDGSSVETPATAETVELLASGGVDRRRILRAGAVDVDHNDVPHIVYSVQENDTGHTILATPREGGDWKRTTLNDSLPDPWDSWQLIMAGGVVFNRRQEMTIVATVQKVPSVDDSWGHPTNEIVRFRAQPGNVPFAFELVTNPDSQRCHWLPNVERATGFNQVPDRPGILHTAGPPGEGTADLLSNEVYFWS